MYRLSFSTRRQYCRLTSCFKPRKLKPYIQYLAWGKHSFNALTINLPCLKRIHKFSLRSQEMGWQGRGCTEPCLNGGSWLSSRGLSFKLTHLRNLFSLIFTSAKHSPQPPSSLPLFLSQCHLINTPDTRINFIFKKPKFGFNKCSTLNIIS